MGNKETDFSAASEWGPYRDKILSPEVFDRMILDDSFLDEIAGVGTYSLSYVRSGINQDNLVMHPVQTYFCDNPVVWIDLSPWLAIKLDSDSYTDVADLTSSEFLREHIYNNRGYGTTWGARDLALERYQTDAFLNLNQEPFDFAHYFVFSKSLPSSDVKTCLDLYMSTPFQRACSRYPRQDWFEKYNTLISIFRSEEEAIIFREEAQKREGVQVIYKSNDKFKDFLEQVKFDSYGDFVAEVHSSIPYDLIGWLVPLGSYEKAQMGVK